MFKACYSSINKRACSAVGSASHSHCGGREFESPQVHQTKSTTTRWCFLFGMVFTQRRFEHFNAARTSAAGEGSTEPNLNFRRRRKCNSSPVARTNKKEAEGPPFLVSKYRTRSIIAERSQRPAQFGSAPHLTPSEKSTVLQSKFPKALSFPLRRKHWAAQMPLMIK